MFSFVRCDSDTTWNVDEMRSDVNVCRRVLPPCSTDSQDSASKAGLIHVMFRAPVRASGSNNRGQYHAVFKPQPGHTGTWTHYVLNAFLSIDSSITKLITTVF